jgi:hypothetical protein
MSTIAYDRKRSQPRGSALPTWRLVSAEVLKLRKRRGLVALTAVTTVGVTLVTYGVLIIRTPSTRPITVRPAASTTLRPGSASSPG